MLRIALLIIGAVLIQGCASKQLTAERPEYCHTTKDILVKNGTDVESMTKVECTDKISDQNFLARSGISKDCREYYNRVVIGGQEKYKRGFVCKKLNKNGEHGGWEIVNPSINF